MNGYLLDSNIVLFALANSGMLTKAVRHAISRGPNFISVVSFWEVVLKSKRGKLDIGHPQTWWDDALTMLNATPILVRPHHVSTFATLPHIHGDPFDRMLIAQALAEDLTFLTSDGMIARYEVPGFKVIR